MNIKWRSRKHDRQKFKEISEIAQWVIDTLYHCLVSYLMASRLCTIHHHRDY